MLSIYASLLVRWNAGVFLASYLQYAKWVSNFPNPVSSSFVLECSTVSFKFSITTVLFLSISINFCRCSHVLFPAILSVILQSWFFFNYILEHTFVFQRRFYLSSVKIIPIYWNRCICLKFARWIFTFADKNIFWFLAIGVSSIILSFHH